MGAYTGLLVFLAGLLSLGAAPRDEIRAPWIPINAGASPNGGPVARSESGDSFGLRVEWSRSFLHLHLPQKSLLEKGVVIGLNPLDSGELNVHQKVVFLRLSSGGKIHWGSGPWTEIKKSNKDSEKGINPGLIYPVPGEMEASGSGGFVTRIPWVLFSVLGGRPEPGSKLWIQTLDGPGRYVVFDGPTPGLISAGEMPWTGTPDPGLPFKTKQVFAEGNFPFPVCLTPLPGVGASPGGKTGAYLISTQPGPYAQTTLMYFDGSNPAKSRKVLELEAVIYDVVPHPDFLKNGYLYVGANGKFGKDQPHKTRITRFETSRAGDFQILKDSAKTIIEWDSNGHNGGAMCFGNDGMMYVTSGDGTSDSDLNLAGQDTTRLLAKALRIDVDRPEAGKGYSVPKDNPWVGRKDFVPEAFAMGLRNPWRISCDKATGNIWIGNNGQDLWETVYLLGKGDNYGWSVVEGTHPFYQDRKAGPKPFAPPAAEHHHSEARSLTGGVTYHGKKFPELAGHYIYGDYSTGKIWAIARPEKDARLPLNPREIADTPHQITGFAIDHDGELLILDHLTGIHTLSPNPMAGKRGTFPTKLSQSGFFLSVPEYKLRPGIIPYDVNSPFWSDGAFKARHFFIPDIRDKSGKVKSQSVTHSPSGPWNFPDGTVLIKSFALEIPSANGSPSVPGSPNNPGFQKGAESSRRWIETRFMVKEDNEWTGYSYAWDADGRDATLVAPGGKNQEFEVIKENKKDIQSWRYPSRAERMVCHSRASGFVLGLCDLQLNREVLRDGNRINQIAWIESLGRLMQPWGNARIDQLRERGKELGLADSNLEAFVSMRTPEGGFRSGGTILDSEPSKFPSLPNPTDPKAGTIEQRVRSYLHVNCAPCHVEAGGGNAKIRLDLGATLAQMNLLETRPGHHAFGLKDAKLIFPGAPEQSVLLHRIQTTGDGKMPPVGRNVTDTEAVKLIRDWIRTLPPPKAGPVPTDTSR